MRDRSLYLHRDHAMDGRASMTDRSGIPAQCHILDFFALLCAG